MLWHGQYVEKAVRIPALLRDGVPGRPVVTSDLT